jgi:phosphohistidine swiveling domain-containing protein
MSNLASGPGTRGIGEGGVVDVRRVMQTNLGLPMVVGFSKAVNITSTSSTYSPSNL